MQIEAGRTWQGERAAPVRLQQGEPVQREERVALPDGIDERVHCRLDVLWYRERHTGDRGFAGVDPARYGGV